MNNPVCAACGHFSRAGALVCEACGARPYAPGGPPPPRATGIPAPPFETAADVLKPMLAVYRAHFTVAGLLVLVTTLPQALIQYALTGSAAVRYSLRAGWRMEVGFSPADGLLLWLLTLACSTLLSASLVYAVVDLQRVGRASAGACLGRGLRALPRVFLVSLLYSIIVGVGYVVFIVPGVILALMFAVCVPAAVLEGRGPVSALKRSQELTSGHKGLIFFTYFIWLVVAFSVNWLVRLSFTKGGALDPLAALLLQTGVVGMLGSTLHVLTVYVYLGLLRERGGGAFAEPDLP